MILLNALALRPRGSGVQTYIRHLIDALPAHTSARLVAMVQPDAAGLLPEGVHPLVRQGGDGVRRGLAGLRGVRGAALVHGLNVALPLQRGRKVVTVHDLGYFDVPGVARPGRVRAARAQTAVAIRRADAIIADSRFTAARLEHWFARPSTVVPLAPSPAMQPPPADDVARVRATHRLPDDFVLHVGTIEPRKDVPGLARACRRIGAPLVLAGHATSLVPPPDDATLLGWVPDGDMPALYASASVVAYPSSYEGFGLPPLEAMACGAVVVATDIPSLRETLAGAATLVPQGDTEVLAGALEAALGRGPDREGVVRAGLARAREFTWAGTAARTVAVYERLGVPGAG